MLEGTGADERTHADDELVVVDGEVVDGAEGAVADHALARHLVLLREAPII
jgi:hypothetical protein